MGLAFSLFSQTFPPNPKFKVEDIPDLTGKVVIVTGGNSGIGEETCKALLSHNAKVYMASRSQSKALASIEALKKETGKEAIFLELDLADLKSVKKSAEEFLTKETDLHVLFNNGGVMIPPIEMLTTDGYDLQFGTNVLGHFYFTKLLIPALLKGAKSSSDGNARIVNTSSSAAYFDKLDWSTFKDSPKRKKMGTQSLYCQSKLGNVFVSNQLAKLYGDQGIISTSLNPGNLRTNLGQHMSAMQLMIIKRIVYPAPLGALTQLWAGTSPETLTFNGKFLIPWARLGPPPAESLDEKQAEELWTWLEEQVKDI